MNFREITVFSEGDASDAGTWSNVPYFFTNTLESQGHIVNRVNVAGNPVLRFLYDRLLCPVLRRTFWPGTSFRYNRSLLYTLQMRHIMKASVRRFPHTDCYISTTFSFSPAAYTRKPCALFCDWTYEYYIHHFLKREPDILEMPERIRQDQMIENADCVFVLFPDVAAHMKDYYGNTHIYYLGNVINADPLPDHMICNSAGRDAHAILFIGIRKYLSGAQSLLRAVIDLHGQYPDITLHIIGMTEKELSDQQLPPYVHCYGYLHKDISAEKELYYDLMDRATVYVNTTPEWAGFSSALESLYHGLPVITTPYESFLDTFGDAISFGYYCPYNTVSDIRSQLIRIFTLTPGEYEDMCASAHTHVLDFTWDRYTHNMLNKLREL